MPCAWSKTLDMAIKFLSNSNLHEDSWSCVYEGVSWSLLSVVPTKGLSICAFMGVWVASSWSESRGARGSEAEVKVRLSPLKVRLSPLLPFVFNVPEMTVGGLGLLPTYACKYECIYLCLCVHGRVVCVLVSAGHFYLSVAGTWSYGASSF